MISEIRMYFLYVVIFVAGVIIGKLLMAIQYAFMKPPAKQS